MVPTAEYNRRADAPLTPEVAAQIAEYDRRDAEENARAEGILEDLWGADWPSKLETGQITRAGLFHAIKLAGRKSA